MTDADTGALLVVGATSNAGKSTVVEALCRALVRRGLPVAPFKAQNMSNHAAVTPDGGEIGRAQAVQASAAGVELDRRMNPILLKPASNRPPHLVVLGDEIDAANAVGYGERAGAFRSTVLDALAGLRSEHRWVIAEGAGGAAEINLLDRDLVNLPLAHAAGMPALLVVDIELGGAFAAAHGTIDLLPPHLRRCVRGVVFNRFRGDPSSLEPGLRELERRNGVPVLGVLPHLGDRPLLGGEDALDVPTGLVGRVPGGDVGAGGVRVAAIRLPHLANASDLDPFLTEPDVTLRWVVEPSQLVDADLIVIPGSRATVSDLGWLRSTGLADALRCVDPAVTVVGLCAGYQMLGMAIDDPIESEKGRVEGLGLLPTVTRFEEPKIVRRSEGTVLTGPAAGHKLTGYQIRFGRPSPTGPDQAWLELDGTREGASSDDGRIHGTSLHGLFDADRFRQSLLGAVAVTRERRYRPAPVGYRGTLDQQFERLADWIEEHLDVDHLLALASTAARPGHGPGWTETGDTERTDHG